MEPASDLCCPPPPPNGPSEHPGAGGGEALAQGSLHSHPFLSQICSIMVTICVSRSIYIHGYINKHKNMDKASQFKYMDIEIKIKIGIKLLSYLLSAVLVLSSLGVPMFFNTHLTLLFSLLLPKWQCCTGGFAVAGILFSLS